MSTETIQDLVVEINQYNNKASTEKLQRKSLCTGPLFHQVSAVILINIVALLGGICNSASAIILPQLQTNTTDLPVTLDERTWIASLGLLGMLVGSLIGALTGDFFGRKRTIILSAIIYAIGMISMAFGYSVFIICFGRFMSGLGYTISKISSQPFICEISSPNLRGLFGAFFSVFFGIGITVLLLLGSLTNWRNVIGGLSTLTIPLVVGVLFLPDSPTWLAKNRPKEECKKANEFYFGNSDYPTSYNDEDESKNEAKSERGFTENMKTKMAHLQDPGFYKPMLLLAPLFFLYDGSGCMILNYFTVEIFEKTGSALNPYHTSVIASSVLIFGGVISSGVLLKFPKKRLYLISAVLLATALASLASYSYCVDNNIMADHVAIFDWLPLVLVMAIYLFDALGFRTIKDILVGELFPTKSSSLGTGAVIFLEQVAGFLMAKAVGFFFLSIKLYGVFFLCTGIVCFCGVWAAILMPETQGLSLEDIQKRYQTKCHPNEEVTF